MNRSQLIEKIALDVGCTKTAAELLVKSFVKIVTESAEPVTITGFGTFERRKRAARSGTSALAGGTWTSEANTQLCFKASKTLRRS